MFEFCLIQIEWTIGNSNNRPHCTLEERTHEVV